MKVTIKSRPGACIFQPMCKIAFAVFIIICLCVYTMMSLFMALQSPNQKTQILYCPSGVPSHTGWRQRSPNSPVNARAYLRPEQRCLHTAERCRGARQPWQRADETIRHILGCEEDLSPQKCFISQKKSWAAVWRVRARRQMQRLCIPYPLYLLLSLSWFILAHQGLSWFT